VQGFDPLQSFGPDVAARYDEDARGDEPETVGFLAELAATGRSSSSPSAPAGSRCRSRNKGCESTASSSPVPWWTCCGRSLGELSWR
jgi:hypothetical protein